MSVAPEHPLSVMVVYGTRPEAIKVAPVISELNRHKNLKPIVVTTAQHREMLDQVNQVFGIVPDVDFNLMEPGQTLNTIASRVLGAMDRVLADFAPSAVLVQGDTTTVLATALAAFNHRIPIVHLEAGLRSGDINSPFPEEANRRLTTQVTALHLAPTSQAADNLRNEGVADDDIVITGNTVIDALQWVTGRPGAFVDPRLSVLDATDRPVLLLTTHRRENLGPNMESIGAAVRQIALSYPDLLVVWPAHKNPAVRDVIRPFFDGLNNVIVIEPLDYDQFAHLLKRSHIVLSDSGGIQEEAPSLGKPVLVLRENTERPEAVAAGTARLVGTNEDRIVREVRDLMDNPYSYAAMSTASNPFGDGRAAVYSVAAIADLLHTRK